MQKGACARGCVPLTYEPAEPVSRRAAGSGCAACPGSGVEPSPGACTADTPGRPESAVPFCRAPSGHLPDLLPEAHGTAPASSR